MPSEHERACCLPFASYRKHCGPRAIECAEGDLLGELLEVAENIRDDLCGLIAWDFRGLLSEEQGRRFNASRLRLQAAIAKVAGDTDRELTFKALIEGNKPRLRAAISKATRQ